MHANNCSKFVQRKRNLKVRIFATQRIAVNNNSKTSHHLTNASIIFYVFRIFATVALSVAYVKVFAEKKIWEWYANS